MTARNQFVGAMPAITQSPWPPTGLTKCHISSNGSAPASAASRIRPWKRTLAMCRPSSSAVSTSLASS